MLDLSPGNCNARHDPPPVVRRGSRRLACEDVGRHPLLRFPAYTEIGNECSLVFNEEQRKRLQLKSIVYVFPVSYSIREIKDVVLSM